MSKIIGVILAVVMFLVLIPIVGTLRDGAMVCVPETTTTTAAPLRGVWVQFFDGDNSEVIETVYIEGLQTVQSLQIYYTNNYDDVHIFLWAFLFYANPEYNMTEIINNQTTINNILDDYETTDIYIKFAVTYNP